MHNLTQSLKVILLAIALSFGISYVFAWTAPTAAPTGGNSTAPLNTSNIDQTKNGGLILNALGITNTASTSLSVAGGAVFGGNVSLLSSFAPDQIDNGTFGNGLKWDFNPGWTFDATYHEADHASGQNNNLQQKSPTTPIIAGSTYQVVFEVKNWLAGSVTPRIGGTLGSPVTSDGTSTQQITTINNNVLSFSPSGTFVGSIDNVSLRILNDGNLTATGVICDSTGCIGGGGILPAGSHAGCILVSKDDAGNLEWKDRLSGGACPTLAERCTAAGGISIDGGGNCVYTYTNPQATFSWNREIRMNDSQYICAWDNPGWTHLSHTTQTHGTACGGTYGLVNWNGATFINWTEFGGICGGNVTVDTTVTCKVPMPM